MLVLVVVVMWLGAGVAAAQSADDAQGAEEVRLVTSTTEVRRAVIGLIATACVLSLATGIYWFKTGEQARARFAIEGGGRVPTPAERAARVGRRVAEAPARPQAPPRFRSGADPAPAAGPAPRRSVFADDDLPWWERDD